MDIEELTRQEFEALNISLPDLGGFKEHRLWLTNGDKYGIISWERDRKYYSFIIINQNGHIEINQEGFNTIELVLNSFHDAMEGKNHDKDKSRNRMHSV